MNMSQMAKTVEKFTIDNSPLILTAVGVTGTVTTAVLTGKASYKAALLIREDDEGRERYDGTPSEVGPSTLVDKVKLVWPLYIPAVGTGVMTISCIIAANQIGLRRAAAMAAAYSISEKAFDEYREKVVEKLGEKKETEIKDEVAQDRMTAYPVGKQEVFVTGNGNVLCYDMYTGRYFESNMEALKEAQNNLNYRLLNDSYASLNDFYSNIGLSNTRTGDEVGWTSDQLMEITFSTTMSDDNRPCIAIDFNVTPTRNYFRVH